MKKLERATSLFQEGFNCAQALLAVYGADSGMSPDLALRVAAAFGGGGARMGETCGAVSGAFMVIGLKYGAADSRDKDAKAKTYQVAAEFVKRFRSRNHSLSCRQLLGFDLRVMDNNDPKNRNVMSEKCPKFIRDSAEILEEILT